MSFGIPVRNDCLRLILDKLSETEEVTEKETDAYYEAAQKVTRSITIPPIILTYIKENMEPYFRNQSSFEACYKDLLNVLEIYKDE